MSSLLVGRTVEAVTRCVKWNNAACTTADWANTQNRQVLVFATGYSAEEEATFWSDFNGVVTQMTGTAGQNVYSRQQKERWLFFGEFRPSSTLASRTALFGAEVIAHPSRGEMLVMKSDDVYARVDQLRSSGFPYLRPFTASVIFNTFRGTANASPPSFIGKPYGTAKFNRGDAQSSWVATHEIGHSGMNFLDEYTEWGMEDLSIRSIDVLTPLLLLNASWRGVFDALGSLTTVYDIDLSEILAADGNDNIALSPFPSTVQPSTPEVYLYEGGMMFGRGTWHMKGKSLMNGFGNLRGPDDSISNTHTPAQQRVINTMYSGVPGRPNNRLRNAGPIDGWPLAFGSKTRVMLFDSDKHHHFQGTKKYTVQVGWYERQWKTCWAAFIPYPCSTDVWKTAERTVTPERRTVNFKISFAYGLLTLTQDLVCKLGIREVNVGGSPFQLCSTDLSTISTSLLPAIEFQMPYQDVDVPASQWMTTYHWRFKTNNGAMDSGYTGWSRFFRSF
ncbi:MAG: hypothetical protein IT381_24580 [Deltaproteobacteria bacterium]|nr:hypothetical protein [Deltaproteobacteria bacterium]